MEKFFTIGPDGRLYAPAQNISIFNIENGSLYHTFPAPNSNIVQFDQDGNLHSPRWDWHTPLIRVYTPSGVLVSTYTPPSSNTNAYGGLFIDKAGNRLVVDKGTHQR